MFFRRKTKENHAKSVQNVRKLLFSRGKTKEKPPPPKKKRDKKKRPKRIGPPFVFDRRRALVGFFSLLLVSVLPPSRLWHCRPNPSKQPTKGVPTDRDRRINERCLVLTLSRRVLPSVTNTSRPTTTVAFVPLEKDLRLPWSGPSERRQCNKPRLLFCRGPAWSTSRPSFRSGSQCCLGPGRKITSPPLPKLQDVCLEHLTSPILFLEHGALATPRRQPATACTPSLLEAASAPASFCGYR